MNSWEKQRIPWTFGRIGVGLPCYLKDEEFFNILKSFAMDLLYPILAKRGNSSLFLEKTPAHSLYIKEINRLFPDSKFIILTRDPFDTCRSLIHAGRTWGESWAPRKAIAAAALWKNYMNSILDNKEKIKSEFYELRYEDLSVNPKFVLSEVFEFLNIDSTERILKNIVEENTKQNTILGTNKEIPIFGQINEITGIQMVYDPKGFVNTKKMRLNIFEKIIIWRKTRIIGRKFNYSTSMKSILFRN